MNNKDDKKISEEIIGRIEKEHIKLQPRFYFTMRNVAMWCLAVASLVLGGLSVSTIIFRLSNVPRILLPPDMRTGSFWEITALIPVAWIIIFGLFGYVTYLEIRRTRQGYKYELSTLLLVMVVVSGVLGLALYKLGSGYAIDQFAGRHVPFQRDVEALQRERWFDPEHGFLVGQVVEESETGFLLTDPEGGAWLAIYASVISEQEKNFIVPEEKVGLLGRAGSTDSTFLVCMIRPLEVRGRGFFPRRLSPSMIKHGTSTHERNFDTSRSNECEGVRPPNIIR